MPHYLTDLESWKALWPLLAIALLISFTLCWVGDSAQERKGLLILLVAFAILGVGTGYLAGLSREPVAGQVLPAVLSLFAGLTVFLVSKDHAARVLVSLSVVAFAVSLLVGSVWGSRMRFDAEQYFLSEKYLLYRASVEAKVQEARRKLGLSDAQK
jgi:tryptophan-rich sensory protein